MTINGLHMGQIGALNRCRTLIALAPLRNNAGQHVQRKRFLWQPWRKETRESFQLTSTITRAPPSGALSVRASDTGTAAWSAEAAQCGSGLWPRPMELEDGRLQARMVNSWECERMAMRSSLLQMYCIGSRPSSPGDRWARERAPTPVQEL